MSTKSPPLPQDLSHLMNGHRVFFYRNQSPDDRTPCRGLVVGRGRDPESGLMRLTIAPDDQQMLAHEITPGLVIYRTVNGVFPTLDHLTSHAQFLEEASPAEVAAWTKSIIELSAMIGGRDE